MAAKRPCHRRYLDRDMLRHIASFLAPAAVHPNRYPMRLEWLHSQLAPLHQLAPVCKTLQTYARTHGDPRALTNYLDVQSLERSACHSAWRALGAQVPLPFRFTARLGACSRALEDALYVSARCADPRRVQRELFVLVSKYAEADAPLATFEETRADFLGLVHLLPRLLSALAGTSFPLALAEARGLTMSELICDHWRNAACMLRREGGFDALLARMREFVQIEFNH